MKYLVMLALAGLACVPMPEDRQAFVAMTSSDGAAELAVLVAAKELPQYDCSGTCHFGIDSYDRLWCVAGIGFEADAGGAAVVASLGAEAYWPEREPLQTRIDLDVLLFKERAVYEVGITGAIDASEQMRVRVRGGVGISY